MPPPPGSKVSGPASPLFRTSGSDVALSMAQRLESVYLAVPHGSRLLLDAEKRILEALTVATIDNNVET
ncbi:hypothetical protein EDC04DRAFT_2631264 [Pisolithus marmoratus]|nr:hypothetical protein EDC04DRAFT_2631264 [Pisolithus marmoratus]